MSNISLTLSPTLAQIASFPSSSPDAGSVSTFCPFVDPSEYFDYIAHKTLSSRCFYRYSPFFHSQISWNPFTSDTDDVFSVIYQTVLYLHLLTLFIPLGVVAYRYNNFGREEAKMGFSHRKFLIWSSPVWVHLWNNTFMLYFPFSGYIYFGFVFHIIWLLVSVPNTVSAIRLKDSKIMRVVDSAESCVTCAIVATFARDNGINLDYKIERAGSGDSFVGEITLPSYKTGMGNHAPGVTFRAAGLSTPDVRSKLSSQISDHWSVLPLFEELRIRSGRSLANVVIISHPKGSTTVTASRSASENISNTISDTSSPILPQTFVPPANSALSQLAARTGLIRTPCPIDVSLAISDGIVIPTDSFNENFICQKDFPSTCSFSLVPGESDLSKFINRQLVTLVRTPVSPYGRASSFFKCDEMAEALPFLLSGHKIQNLVY